MSMDDDLDRDLDQDLDEDKDEVDTPAEDRETDESGTAVNDDGSVDVPVEAEANADADSTETDDEREKIRESRRQERQERKQRVKERDERLRRELESERTARRQLEDRLNTLERKSTGSEMAQLESAEKQLTNAYTYQKDRIKEALAAGNGEEAADATEKMMLISKRQDQLQGIKKAYTERQRQPAPLDTRLVDHANKFMGEHTWYKPDGGDQDSQITRTIDNALANEGWDPKTPEYWKELRERVKKYLPHRSRRATVADNDASDDNDEAEDRPRKKSVVAGSGRNASAASAKNTFRLSSERVQALKEAGMWNDTKVREAAIKRYRDYDKTNKKG